MYVRCEFCDRSNVEVFQWNEKSIIRKVARPVNELLFELSFSEFLQWDFINNLNSTSRDSCQKSKLWILIKKLKSVINFKLVASVGLTLLTSLRIVSHWSHPQKSICRKIRKKICQKLLESYPNCMLCMSAFFYVKRCQNRVQNSWSVSSYTLHARPCFPLQEGKASLFLFNAISI